MVEVDDFLNAQIKDQKTPSVQYLIFDKDSIIYKYRKGLADIKNSRETADKTTYKAFSVTKTFTALAILQLAEKNKLNIEDPVKKYLPAFPYPSSITAKQLLSHSAGIPNPIPLNWIHLAEEENSFNRNTFFSEIFRKNKKLKAEPNEKFSYSNLNYVLLGQLIEKITGIEYEAYIRNNIIKPLNLKPEDLDFTVQNIEKHAKGYFKRFSFMNLLLGFFIDKTKYLDQAEGSWIALKNNYVNGAPYGGLLGTADAFVKYIQELLKDDCLLISDYHKQLLFTENYTRSNKATGMCLSWFSGHLYGKQYFAHAGGGGGYYAEIRIYPQLKLGSVIMFNRTGISDERFLDKTDIYFID